MRTLGVILGLVLAAGLIVFFGFAPRMADRRMNTTVLQPPYKVSDSTHVLHRSLNVVDLHSDFLLWDRDLLDAHDYGHLDLPRLIEANVTLEVFSAVTKVPWGSSYEGTPADSDKLPYLFAAQLWPVSTWYSLDARALYQAKRLHRFAERAGERFTIITNQTNLHSYLQHRRENPNISAGLLAIEGLHAMEGELSNLERFYERGYRIMSLTHMFDNRLAGSAQGLEKGGLTSFGRRVVRQLNERRIIIDLAHLSSRAIDEVLERTRRPVVVSHTGVQGTCPSPRNLSDQQIERVADTGGVIGIGFWERAVCGKGVESIVDAIRHAADVAGVEHVGLGSDFDGTVHTAFDVSGLPLLTEALRAEGFSEEEIAKIMGGNSLRVLKQALPPGPNPPASW